MNAVAGPIAPRHIEPPRRPELAVPMTVHDPATLSVVAMAVEQAAEAVMVTDPSGVIEYVNPAFERVTGWTRAEVVGQTPRVVKSGRHDATFYAALWRTLGAGEVWRGRFVNRRKDGRLFEEEGSISPVRDATGQVAHFVAVKRDVTRERELEEQVRHAMKMEAVGRLAGGLAHDFNNVLNVILGNTELGMQRLPTDHPARRYCSEVIRATQHAATLTQQLLSFSRARTPDVRRVDLGGLVREVEPMLRRLIGEDVVLHTRAEPGLGCVLGDPSQMTQVIMNLAVNARDAMPRGGDLVVEVSETSEADCVTHGRIRAGRWTRLTVRDTGAGMDQETVARAFEPFFTTKPEGRGTGLGLSTVYGIVEQCGGHITVESAPVCGTSFHVFLPVSGASSPEDGPGATSDGRHV